MGLFNWLFGRKKNSDVLPVKESKKLMNMLDNPPPPNTNLKRAAARVSPVRKIRLEETSIGPQPGKKFCSTGKCRTTSENPTPAISDPLTSNILSPLNPIGPFGPVIDAGDIWHNSQHHHHEPPSPSQSYHHHHSSNESYSNPNSHSTYEAPTSSYDSSPSYDSGSSSNYDSGSSSYDSGSSSYDSGSSGGFD